jgi:superfamily II DNA helicase RecQ
MIIVSTYFLHGNAHKETWQSPDGRTNNEIGRVLVDGRNEPSIMDIRSCRGADCDWDHHLVRINIDRKYQSTKHTHTHGVRLRKYDVKMLQDKETMRIYVEEIRKGITENSEQQNNQNEETSENKWKKLRKWRKRLLARRWDMKKGRRGMI